MTEIMKRHLAKPREVELDNGDKITMSPLSVGDIPQLYEVQTNFAKNMKFDEKTGKVKGDMEIKLEQQDVTAMIDLIKKSIKKANSDVDSEVLDEFIASNFMKLMPHLFSINSLESGRDRIKREKAEKIKQKIEGGKSNTGDNS